MAKKKYDEKLFASDQEFKNLVDFKKNVVKKLEKAQTAEEILGVFDALQSDRYLTGLLFKKTKDITNLRVAQLQIDDDYVAKHHLDSNASYNGANEESYFNDGLLAILLRMDPSIYRSKFFPRDRVSKDTTMIAVSLDKTGKNILAVPEDLQTDPDVIDIAIKQLNKQVLAYLAQGRLEEAYKIGFSKELYGVMVKASERKEEIDFQRKVAAAEQAKSEVETARKKTKIAYKNAREVKEAENKARQHAQKLADEVARGATPVEVSDIIKDAVPDIEVEKKDTKATEIEE